MLTEVKQMTRVLLAEDHAVVAEGLAALMRDEFELVGSVRDGRALMEAVDRLKPDVIVTDISMPLLNGLDAVRQIKKDRPHARIIVLTMHADPDLAVQAFRAGASGYVLKSSPGEELMNAVRQVAQGKTYLTSMIAQDFIHLMMDAKEHPEGEGVHLTKRQREILQLVGEGKTMKEVAAVLGISSRTAESHKYEMMRILGAKTTADLIHHAIKLKLVSK